MRELSRLGLEHNRISNAPGDRLRLFNAARQATLGYPNPKIRQNLFTAVFGYDPSREHRQLTGLQSGFRIGVCMPRPFFGKCTETAECAIGALRRRKDRHSQSAKFVDVCRRNPGTFVKSCEEDRFRRI